MNRWVLALVCAASMGAVAMAQEFGAPVNTYPPNNVYAQPRDDGEIHAAHVRGQVWLLTGQPDQANVLVQVGDQGVLVVDTGVGAMAPKLLAQIQRLAQEHGSEHKEIRRIVNTSGGSITSVATRQSPKPAARSSPAKNVRSSRPSAVPARR